MHVDRSASRDIPVETQVPAAGLGVGRPELRAIAVVERNIRAGKRVLSAGCCNATDPTAGSRPEVCIISIAMYVMWPAACLIWPAGHITTISAYIIWPPGCLIWPAAHIIRHSGRCWAFLNSGHFGTRWSAGSIRLLKIIRKLLRNACWRLCVRGILTRIPEVQVYFRYMLHTRKTLRAAPLLLPPLLACPCGGLCEQMTWWPPRTGGRRA